jgi:hypothetical protein
MILENSDKPINTGRSFDLIKIKMIRMNLNRCL